MRTNVKISQAICSLMSLAVVFLLSLACGGGGGGGGGDAGSSDSSLKLKARFNPQGILNYLDGDQLYIYKLGEDQPITEIENLADVPGFVTATFDLNANYLLVVRRLGVVNFLSTVITEDQIEQARQTGVLSLGKLNSITTLLSHYLDLSSGTAPFKSTTEINAELSKYFEGVSSFSELSFDVVKNQIVKKDAFYEDFANRANAMTAFSSLLHLKQKESIASGVELTQAQKNGYFALHNAILTGNISDWIAQVKALESAGVLPDLDNSLLSFLDGNADASKNLGIQNKLFETDGTYYVIDASDLHSVFYDVDAADESLFDNFVDSDLVPRTENSVISGNITGPGMDGAEVVLYRDNKDQTAFVVQSVVSDSNGEFDFGNVPADDSYRVMVKKAGYLYKAGSVLTKAGNVQVSINSYSWDNDTLVLDGSDNISLADGAVTSAKLASDIAIQNLTVTGAANLGGMVIPESSTGTAGQILALDANGNLVFVNDIDTDTDTDTVLDVAGAVTLIGNWVNTANPWANNEVASDLTIDGGSVDNTPVGSTNASTGVFTDLSATNSFNVNGLSFPTADGMPNQVLSTDGAGNITFMTVSISNDGQTYTQVEIESGNVTGNVIGATLTGSSIDSTPIGANSPSTGAFTTLITMGSTNLGGLLMPTADGTVGQFLMTDGAGNLIFANTSSGGGAGANLLANEVISGDWVNTANPWADNEVANSITVDGGNINNSPVGATTPSTGAFTTLEAVQLTANGANINGFLLPVTDGSAGQILTTDGSGNLVFANDATGAEPYFGPWANANISSELTIGTNSTIDDTPIGSTTPSTASFTTLVTTGSVNLSGLLMPTTDGTVGQVLITDGAGNLLFANASSGGGSGANLLANETIFGNWVNTANPWANNEVASDLTIDGGTVDNSPVGSSTPSTGAFTTLSANLGFSVNGMSFPITDGTANQVLATDGSGNIVFLTISNDGQIYTNALIQSGNFTGNVSGDISASTFSLNGMTYPVVDGSANQVLATDGAGALTFIDVSTSNDGQVYTNAWIQSGNFMGNVVSSTLTAATIGASSFSLNGITYPIVDGSANQVLATDGSGTLTFIDVSTSNDGQTYTQVEIESGNVTGNIIGSAMTASTIDSTAIGATTPSTGAFTTLSANVSFSLNGITYPIVDGSANQVLATDGSGTLTFIDVSTSNDGQTYTNAWILSGNFTGNVTDSMVDNSPIGSLVGSSGNFTSLTATTNLTVDGSANLSGLVYPTVDGSANQFLVTAGNGHMSFASVNVLLGGLAGSYTIEGGSIDGTVIGATNPAAGTFTALSSDNLTVSEDITAGNLTLSGNMTDLVVVGNTTLGDNATNDSLTIMSTVGAGSTLGGNIWFQGNLISNSDTYSLGTKSSPWKRIYAIDLVTTSDERLKEEIEPLEYGIDEVMKLKPVSYKWKDQSKEQERTLGFLAQEVETVIDEVVTDTSSEEETIGVRYANMVPVLIKAMQQQQKMIEKQARLIEEQAKRLEALETKPSE